MKVLYKYKDGKLVFTHKLSGIDNDWRIGFLNECFGKDGYSFEIKDKINFMASDEYDGKISSCCGAKTKNGLCSDCKENIF